MELFTCARKQMRLTPRGCSALFLKAQERKPNVWEGHHACIGCPTGAKNAGQVVPTVTVQTAELLRPVCPRCCRVNQRIIGNRLCVSCYNRQREVITGFNAKGTPPVRLTAMLHSETLAVAEGDAEARRVEMSNVVCAAEMMFVLARKAKRPLAFGWGRHVDAAA